MSFPVGLQAVGAALGGTAGVRAATAGNVQVDKIGGQEVRRMGQKMPARKVAAMGLGRFSWWYGWQVNQYGYCPRCT